MSSQTEHPNQRPFFTEQDTMLSISAAFSTIHNPCGLEACYKAAWISTQRDACAFSNRLCVSTEGYVTVSGTVMRELSLQIVQRENEQTRAELNIRTRVANLHAGGTAQSSRITQAELSNIRHEKQVLEKSERVARAERRAIEKERDECSFQNQNLLLPCLEIQGWGLSPRGAGYLLEQTLRRVLLIPMLLI